jgi:hypothetical protein
LPPVGSWLGQFLPTRSKDDAFAADPHCPDDKNLEPVKAGIGDDMAKRFRTIARRNFAHDPDAFAD